MKVLFILTLIFMSLSANAKSVTCLADESFLQIEAEIASKAKLKNVVVSWAEKEPARKITEAAVVAKDKKFESEEYADYVSFPVRSGFTDYNWLLPDGFEKSDYDGDFTAYVIEQNPEGSGTFSMTCSLQ